MGDSVRDTIAAAFDAQDSGSSAEPEAASTEAAVTQADPGGETKTEERARDERGRFTESKQAAQAAPDQPDQARTTPAEAQATAPIEPPSSWSAEAKAVWATLTPEARRIVADREAEAQKTLTQRAQEQADIRRRYAEIDQVLEPYRQRLALSGVSEGQAIRQLLAAQDMLTRNPVEGLRWLANQYRIDTSALIQQQTEEDPKYAALSRELQSMRQMLETRSQQEQEQSTQSLAMQINDWRLEQKDGKPIREYYDLVENDMAAMIPVIRQAKPMASTAEVLQEAYDRATWAHPEVRQRMLQAQSQAEEAKRIAEAARKADEAKKAAVSVVGSPGGATARTVGTVREELLRNWDSRAA